MVILWWVMVINGDIPSGTRLSLWKISMVYGKKNTTSTGPCSIATLNYQRVDGEFISWWMIFVDKRWWISMNIMIKNCSYPLSIVFAMNSEFTKAYYCKNMSERIIVINYYMGYPIIHLRFYFHQALQCSLSKLLIHHREYWNQLTAHMNSWNVDC